jgi:hypothetical protein
MSIDTIHEIGDVIVPNVFLSFNAKVLETEMNKDNRESFVENPRFLEIFQEQKDYYVEDFGLSVGGIIVDQCPERTDSDHYDAMMLAYEGDIYVEETLTHQYDGIIDNQVPSLVIAGVIIGKENQKHAGSNPHDLATRNMITTMSLLEE